jgi:hypothetical protein
MIHWRDLNGRALRVLRGVTLPCGCVGGVYETYAGTTVMIIDEVDDACRSARHRNGHVVSLEAGEHALPHGWSR